VKVPLLPLLALSAQLCAGPVVAQESAGRGGSPPTEQLLTEAWRWRQIAGPAGEQTRFFFVRPGPDGTLMAADADGLASFDGHGWTRIEETRAFNLSELRGVVSLDGLTFVVSAESVLVVGGGAPAKQLAGTSWPDFVAVPTEWPPGRPVMGVGRRLLALSGRDGGSVEEVLQPPAGVSHITAVVTDTSGLLWCCAEEGLYRWQGERWQPMQALPGGATSLYHALRAGDELVFLPLNVGELTPGYAWDGRQLRAIGPGTSSVLVSDATVAPDGAVVIARRAPELAVLRDGRWSDARPPIPSSEGIRSVCLLDERRLAMVTASGNLWVCDLGASRWEIHDPAEVGLSRAVNALAPSRRGGLWLSTHEGIGRWDGQRFTDVHFEAGETGVQLQQTTTVCEDPQGRLWVGAGASIPGALCLHPDGRWTLHDGPDEIGRANVHAIRRWGDELWFALLSNPIEEYMRGGIVRLRGDTFTRWDTSGGAHLTRTYDIVPLPDGRMLAGSRGALHVLEGEAWRPIEEPLIRDASAFALHADREGSVWVGLGLAQRGIVLRREDRSVLLSDGSWSRAAAASFAMTAEGRLWMASENGLFLVLDDECNAVSDLLPARNFWPSMDDGRGGLYLGSLGSGLVHFRPDDRLPPRTQDLAIRYSPDGHAEATWETTDAWNDTPPERLRFRVRLDGQPLAVGLTWHRGMARHELDLGRLRHGRHEFSVQAVDSFGNVERTAVWTVFDVPPPLWLSTPMLLLLGALAATAASVVFVMARRRHERAQAAAAERELTERLSVLARRLLSTQEDERRRLSRELHDDLGQLLTAVCLDLQNSERQSDQARRTDAVRQARQTTLTALDRVREISTLLRPSVLDDLGLEQAVRSALSDFTARTGVDTQVQLSIGIRPVPDIVAGHLYRILHEALTNVARHAQAATVWVRLEDVGDTIELSVRDDGQGFQVDALPLELRFGLLGMRERAELLGGRFQLESTPGSGTGIRVSIPLASLGGATREASDLEGGRA
jgi:signal transduction histidine kinase